MCRIEFRVYGERIFSDIEGVPCRGGGSSRGSKVMIDEGAKLKQSR